MSLPIVIVLLALLAWTLLPDPEREPQSADGQARRRR